MKTRKIRLTLDVSPEFNQRLERLRGLVDADTKADVIRHALQVYEFLAQKTAQGYAFRTVSSTGAQSDVVFLGPFILQQLDNLPHSERNPGK